MKKIIYSFIFIVILSTAFAGSAFSQDSRTQRIVYNLYSNPDRILVAAHRGAHHDYPENSLGAFREAIRLGVDIVEIDVRSTKDGVAVIMHDGSVDRTTNGKGRVSEMTFDEIRGLRLTHNGVATDERVPSLEELLELTKGHIAVDVDFKADASFAKTVCDAVMEAGMEDQVLFFLYDYRLIPTLKQLAPGIRIMPRANSREDVGRILSLDADVPVIHIDKSFYDDAFFAGLPRTARIWSNALGEYDNYEDTKEGLRQMLHDMPHVNVIQTDNPAELIELLKEARFARLKSKIEKNENDRTTPEGKTTVSGSVSNVAGKPIIAEVCLYRGKVDSPLHFTTLKTWMTDTEGRFSFEVPAPHEGFHLLVSKGGEYEYVEIPFDVQADCNTSINVNIARIVEDQTLEGWWAGDGHQHSGGPLGSDGAEGFEDVAMHNVAAGIHWGVLSEHRHMNSTESFVNATRNLPVDFKGNGGRFYPVIGYEWGVSGTGQGHMNVLGQGAKLMLPFDFAAESDTLKRNATHAKTILEFQAGGAFVQANHPTANGGLRFMRGGVDYDRAWFIDAFEIWNSDGDNTPDPYEGATPLERSFTQWFKLLNMGARVPGTATTDSHQLDLPARKYGDITVGTILTKLSDLIDSNGGLDHEYYDKGGFETLWTTMGGTDEGLDTDSGSVVRFLTPALRRSLKGVSKADAKELIARAFKSDIAPNLATYMRIIQSGAMLSGNTMTWVHIPGDFSETALFEGLRDGRSVMSSGPILKVTLNGQEPDIRYGHEALLDADGRATLSIDLTSNRNMEWIYIVADGELIRKIPIDGMNYREDISLHLAGRKWIVVDVRGEKFAKAMTNPIFLATAATKDALSAKAELSELVDEIMLAHPEVAIVGQYTPEQPQNIVDLRYALDAAVRPVLFNPQISKQQVDIAIEHLRKAAGR